MIKKMIKNREKYLTLSLEQKRMICKYNDDHKEIIMDLINLNLNQKTIEDFMQRK